jgi:hypothetical protein
VKKTTSFIAALLALLLVFPIFALAEGEQAQTSAKSQVLLVCNDNNGREGLEKLIRSCGKSVNSISETEYRATLLLGYSYLVTTINTPYRDAVKLGIKTVCIGENAGHVDGVVTVPLEDAQVQLRLDGHTQTKFIKSAIFIKSLSEDSTAYGSLERIDGQTFPFAVIGRSAAYVPWYTEDGLSIVMLGGLFRQYFNGASSENGKMYLALDEIYPFSDLDMLRKSADLLDENGIPFIVRIMPVYENFDYPAFLRFTQALLYVQSKGGSIVLHNPLIQEDEYVRESLETRLSRAKKALADAGITVLEMNYPPLEIKADDIQRIISSEKSFGTFPIDTMVCFKLFNNSEELKKAMQSINNSWLTLSNYKAEFSLEDSVYVEKVIDSDYIFRAKQRASLQGFFTGVNRVLLIIVGGGVAVFVLILIAGNRIYRKKFYKK